MITVHKRTARRFLAAMAGVVLAGTGIGYAGRAGADDIQTGAPVAPVVLVTVLADEPGHLVDA